MMNNPGLPSRMSGDEVNPAAEAQPVEDVQGDGRWLSQVCVYGHDHVKAGNQTHESCLYCI